eukprot:g1674.t1
MEPPDMVAELGPTRQLLSVYDALEPNDRSAAVDISSLPSSDAAAKKRNATLHASPFSKKARPKDWKQQAPVEARAEESVKAVIARMFRERPAKPILGEARRPTLAKPVPDFVNVAKKHDSLSLQKRGQKEGKSAAKKKASASAKRGRRRRQLEAAGKFLSKNTTWHGQERASKKRLSRKQIEQWLSEIPADTIYPKVQMHLVQQQEKKDASNNDDGQSDSSIREKKRKPKSELEHFMELADPEAQKRKVEAERLERLRYEERNRAYWESPERSFKKKKFGRSAHPLYNDYKGLKKLLPYGKVEPHKNAMSGFGGKHKLTRSSGPNRMPKALKDFWENHRDVAPKILTDKWSLSSFEVPSDVAKLPTLSAEMQAQIEEEILSPERKSIWTDFWYDEVGSQLARPKSASMFIEGELPGSTAAPRFVDSTAASDKLLAVHERFDFAPHVHQAAGKMQRLWKRYDEKRGRASCVISRVFRGYMVRRFYKERAEERHCAATIMTALARGRRGRKLAAFIRRTGWGHVALACQKVVRGFLARQLYRRIIAARLYWAATNIMRRWRGILARREAAERRRILRDLSSRKIQNAVRWMHFRKGHNLSRRRFNNAAKTIQRVQRGRVGRAVAAARRRRLLSAKLIQRIYRGYRGRIRFFKKMSVVRNACTVVQNRMRSILAREHCARFRAGLIETERLRTEREERYVARSVQNMVDLMRTKRGGWKKYKDASGSKVLGAAAQARKEVIAERRLKKAAMLLLVGRTRRLHILRDWFELCDSDGSGYITRDQFENLMAEMVIPMTNAEIDSAWQSTEPKRGGYRAADILGRRELGEIVQWFERHQSRGSIPQRVRRGSRRQWLKLSKFFRDLWGRSKKQATRKLCAQARAQALEEFRKIEPPPCGTCSECGKRHIFSYELELHYRFGDGKCPGLYCIPQLSKYGLKKEKERRVKEREGFAESSYVAESSIED